LGYRLSEDFCSTDSPARLIDRCAGGRAIQGVIRAGSPGEREQQTERTCAVPVVPTPEPTPLLEAVPGTLSTSVGPPALMPLSSVSPSAAGVAGSADAAGSLVAGGSGSDTAAGAGCEAADGVATAGVSRLGGSGSAVLTGSTIGAAVTPPVAAPMDVPEPPTAVAADLMPAAAA